MTRVLRELERVEDRVLGALRFVDAASGAEIRGPVEVRSLSGPARFLENASGLRVIASWSGLTEHGEAFQTPPPVPEVGSLALSLSVTDPSGRYLPRRVSLPLPRDPDPARAAQPGSLFRAQLVPLYPAPAAPVGANWAVVRVSVRAAGSGDRLGGALLRARRNGDVLARGLSDGRGEGLLALPGVPMLTFGEEGEAVVVEQIAITVEAVFDPAAGTRLTQDALRAGVRPPSPLVDPDALEAGAAMLPRAERPLQVAARRVEHVEIDVDLP